MKKIPDDVREEIRDSLFCLLLATIVFVILLAISEAIAPQGGP